MQSMKRTTVTLVIALAAGLVLLLVWRRSGSIYAAAKSGNVAAVAGFIESGVDVDAQNKEGYTALHIAAAGDYPEIIEILIDAGAEVDKKDSRGETPLQYAALRGKTRAVETLIHRGADVNGRNRSGVTPIYATTMGRGDFLGVAKLLIEHGADLNVRDPSGLTPLHRAVQNGEPEILRLLLSAGASTTVKDNGGLTPLELAEACCGRGPRVARSAKLQAKYEECSKILKEYRVR